jgi:hypothetical protein
MAHGTGVYLDYRNATGRNASRIVIGLLIPFDNGPWVLHRKIA